MANSRTKSFLVRLTEDELEQLNELVGKTGLSREEYVRTLIKGIRPVELPDKDFRETAYQLKRLGYSMNQIAYEAHVKNFVDKKTYQRTADIVVSIALELNNLTKQVKEQRINGTL